ncbi:MAG: hypothetical protein KDK33_10970, partial [Leptospiraceae bacterium]|nr:hypothetical protein [Leptospiraceae bacterium]
GDLFLYVVRTKSELGGESENSEAASAYKDPEVVAVKHRLLPGAGLDRFQGKWSGQYYDGKVRKVTLSVNASGSNFTLQLSVDGSSKTYQGKYAAMSDVLDTGALVVRLDQQDSDLLYVEAAEEVPGAGGRNFTVVKQN